MSGIKFLQIRIEPYRSASAGEDWRGLRVKLETYYKVYQFTKIANVNEFTSHFDYIFDEAKRNILEIIKNDPDNQ